MNDDLLYNILKNLEQGQILRRKAGFYELKHDSLAPKIVKKRTAEQQTLNDAYNIIKQNLKGGTLTELQLSQIIPLREKLKTKYENEEIRIKAEAFIYDCTKKYADEKKEKEERFLEAIKLKEEAEIQRNIAEKEKEKAERQRIFAEDQKINAENEKEKAEDQSRIAKVEKERAEKEIVEAENARKAAKKAEVKATKRKWIAYSISLLTLILLIWTGSLYYQNNMMSLETLNERANKTLENDQTYEFYKIVNLIDDINSDNVFHFTSWFADKENKKRLLGNYSKTLSFSVIGNDIKGINNCILIAKPDSIYLGLAKHVMKNDYSNYKFNYARISSEKKSIGIGVSGFGFARNQQDYFWLALSYSSSTDTSLNSIYRYDMKGDNYDSSFVDQVDRAAGDFDQNGNLYYYKQKQIWRYEKLQQPALFSALPVSNTQPENVQVFFIPKSNNDKSYFLAVVIDSISYIKNVVTNESEWIELPKNSKFLLDGNETIIYGYFDKASNKYFFRGRNLAKKDSKNLGVFNSDQSNNFSNIAINYKKIKPQPDKIVKDGKYNDEFIYLKSDRVVGGYRNNKGDTSFILNDIVDTNNVVIKYDVVNDILSYVFLEKKTNSQILVLKEPFESKRKGI